MIAELFQPGKMRHQGAGILGPEDDGLDVVRLERNIGYLLSIKGIHHGAILFFNPFQKPFCIEGRNIGPPTHANNQCSHPQIGKTIRPVSNLSSEPKGLFPKFRFFPAGTFWDPSRPKATINFPGTIPITFFDRY